MIKGEEFRSVAGYEGYYEISNLGTIKRLSRKREGHVCEATLPEKVLHLSPNNQGYIVVGLRRGGVRRGRGVHTLVAEAFIPNPDCLPMVNHKDTDKTNNQVNNLEWCDNAHNIKHAHDNGRMLHTKYAKGAAHGMSTVSESTVLEIKRLLATGISSEAVASACGVNGRYVGKIKRGERWAWLTI